MVKDRDVPIRVSNDYQLLVREVQMHYAKIGKPVPSASEVSKMIANDIRKRGLLYDEFISFK